MSYLFDLLKFHDLALQFSVKTGLFRYVITSTEPVTKREIFVEVAVMTRLVPGGAILKVCPHTMHHVIQFRVHVNS